jgi:tetratricopeptide (TPR) repeat protein
MGGMKNMETKIARAAEPFGCIRRPFRTAAINRNLPGLTMAPGKYTRSYWLALLFPLMLAACPSAPKAPGPQAPATQPVAAPGTGSRTDSTAKNQEQPAPKQLVLPDVELTEDMLYQFLLGEVALKRGRPDLAVQAYLDLARSTRDPRVARRAAQIAYETRQADKATEAFTLWLEIEPDSQPARQMLISMLLATGKLEEARPWLAQYIAAAPENAGSVFKMLSPLMAHSANKSGALKLVRDLAQPYPKVPEAHMAVARAAVAAGKDDEALAEVRRARALRPDSTEAVLFEAELLKARPQEALAALKGFLDANPEAGEEVRLAYARLLLETKQYAAARVEFQKLQAAHPENAELAFAVALLSLQLGELDRAEKELQQALARGNKDQNAVHYYLGQLYEAKKDTPGAIAQYGMVRGGEHAFNARLREAWLLSIQGKLDEGRELLHHVRTQNKQQQLQVLMLEAEMCRDAHQLQEAYRLLRQGLEQFPEDPDLIYEAGLVADRLGKTDEMEQLMRKLIAAQPDSPNALNALGYSFLERNVRIEEGMALVEKAYRLAPDDAAVIDSMGWGYFRLGNLDKSLEFLRRAYAANPDPEIAAHLGEVLWLHGDKEEAKKIWAAARKQHPDNETLQQVTRKYQLQ